MAQSTNNLDILSLEFQIREKMEELEWKTQALEDVKKELTFVRAEFGEQQLALEDERRKVNELKRQLQSVIEVSHLLEKENSSHRSEKHQMQVNYELIQRERNSLFDQVRQLKAQNIQLQFDIQELNETINKGKYKNIEQSSHQLIDEIKQNITNINSNILKIGKEQDSLRKSVEGVICLKKRLQTVALCIHAHYKRQENQIQSLQRKLATVSCIEPSTNRQTLVDRNSQCESQINPHLVMRELKLQEEDFEKQLDIILNEQDNLSIERQEH